MLQKINILLVTKSPEERKFITSLLDKSEDFTFTIESASDLHKAKERLSQKKYSVLIHDIAPEKEIGLDRFRKITQRFPDLPIILLGNGETMEFDEKLALIGIQDYLDKTELTSKSLIHSIIFAIERKMNLQANQGNLSRDILSVGSNDGYITEFFDVLEEELFGLYDAVRMSTDSIVLLDIDGNIKEVNEATLDLLGIDDMKHAIGTPYSQFFIQKDRPRLKESVELLRDDERIPPQQYKLITPNNEVMTVEISLAAVKNASDAIIGFVAIGRDVTIRTEYEEGMREQIYFLQQLIDRIPNPVFFKGKNGIYLGCNMAFEEFLGMEKHEVIGKTVYDIAPEEKAEKYYEMDNKLFQKGGYQVYEYSVEDANGNIHEVIFHKASFSNLNGDIAGLVGVINDITDYKTLESNFHETEKLFQFLFDNFDTPLYLFEMKGNRFELHEVNYNACQALGYDKNELLQLSPKDIFQKFIQGKSKDKLLADKRVEVSTKRIDKTGKKVPIKLVAVLIEHKDLNTVLAIEEKS